LAGEPLEALGRNHPRLIGHRLSGNCPRVGLE
jgi:hypothetical protein